MKNLGFSLIAVVITAVVGLGWLITEVNYWLERDNLSVGSELVSYQNMGKGLALTLDELSNKQEFLDIWQQNNSFNITIQPRNVFPIPNELLDGFESGEPLILEADENISLHFLLPRSNEVMSLVLSNEVEFVGHSKVSLILTLVFYSGVAAIILLWLYPLIKRLIILGNAAQTFGKGDLSARVETNRTSYITTIENEFNHMADRIQTLIADNKILSGAVSHNLKTPLARLRFGIDTWDETDDKALREKYLARINKDLSEMESLIETLLQYARLDQANIVLKNRKIALKSFVSELFSGIENSEIKVNYSYTDEPGFIFADDKYLAMLLNNIINNAFVYARTRINVSLTVAENIIRLNIEDDGTGIPINERSDVIKPFLRGKDNEGNKGHGMGLAIADRIARWFDAQLFIDDSQDLGGAKISLIFAIHESPE